MTNRKLFRPVPERVLVHQVRRRPGRRAEHGVERRGVGIHAIARWRQQRARSQVFDVVVISKPFLSDRENVRGGDAARAKAARGRERVA